ncbi:MAG: hypothetical protein ACYTHN_22565, partial [Planctomycetota bacterium]
MAVYCEKRPHAEILEEIGESRNLLLLGCTGCANMSCSIQEEEQTPFMKLTLLGPRFVPMAHELSRAGDVMKASGASVTAWTPPGMLGSL